MKTRVPHEPSAEAIRAAYRDIAAAHRRFHEARRARRKRERRRAESESFQVIVVWVCLLGILLCASLSALAGTVSP